MMPPYSSLQRIRVAESARDLGVVIDSKLSLSAHVAALCRSVSTTCANSAQCSDHSAQCSEAARTLVFISNRLDYCNSLLYGLPHSLIHRVQSVQNAAARLLAGTRRGDHVHISPVLRQLHRLPVQRRVDFKLACFVFSTLSGQAHPYLVDE